VSSTKETPLFARIKKSGRYEYLQIVENTRSSGKVQQRVIATVGRLDQIQAKGQVETLNRSLARFSEKTLLVLSGKADVTAQAVTAGPVLIFERLWHELGLPAMPLQSVHRPGAGLLRYHLDLFEGEGGETLGQFGHTKLLSTNKSCTTGRAGGLNCEPLKAVKNLEPPKGGGLFK